jgi:hypothetical protein
MISESSAVVNARGHVFANSRSAYGSHPAGLSRIIISTSPPVSTMCRIRESRHMMPTFNTCSAGQYTA